VAKNSPTKTNSVKANSSKNTALKNDSSKKNDDFYLHFKINHPIVEFELTTKDPTVLDKMQALFSFIPDIDISEFQEVSLKLSEPFTKNPDVAKLLQDLLARQQDYRIASVEIPTVTSIDLQQNTRDSRVNKKDVKQSIQSLFNQVDGKAVRNGIIHVAGELSNEDKALIVDHIHKNMPTAQLRAFQSPRSKNQSGVFVECIFFGEFEDAEEY
jgi:hypothetical protein